MRRHFLRCTIGDAITSALVPPLALLFSQSEPPFPLILTSIDLVNLSVDWWHLWWQTCEATRFVIVVHIYYIIIVYILILKFILRKIIIVLVTQNLKFCFITPRNYWSSHLIYNELGSLHEIWHLSALSLVIVINLLGLHADDLVHVWHTCERSLIVFSIMLSQLCITPGNLGFFLLYELAQIIINPLSTDLATLVVLQYLPLLLILIADLLHPLLLDLPLNFLLMLLCRHVACVCRSQSLSGALSVHLVYVFIIKSYLKISMVI